MTAGQLIVLRHGRTEWNATGRFQGQADIPLDDRGGAQAERAARVLAELAPAAIVSSDLPRATQTAGALAELTGLAVATDQRLREIHVGSWEGLTIEEILEVDPDLAARYLAGEDVRRSATGETIGEVAERVAEALTEIADAAADGSTVVVVMHGLAARVGVCRLVGLPPETWRHLGGLHNCGWITVERHRFGDYWRIADYNVTRTAPVRRRRRARSGCMPGERLGRCRRGRWARIVILVALVVAAFNLRPAVTSVGPVLEEIRTGLGMGGVVAGLLTALPAACFVAFGSLAPRLVARTFPSRLIWIALAAVTLGLAVRPFMPGTATFVLVSCLALGGIGVANIMMPVVVRRAFPQRIGMVTGGLLGIDPRCRDRGRRDRAFDRSPRR